MSTDEIVAVEGDLIVILAEEFKFTMFLYIRVHSETLLTLSLEQVMLAWVMRPSVNPE